jgi:hypothetical protein
VAIVHHNIDAGLNVRWQGNATNAWGAPSIDQAITIPTYEQGSPRWPINPWLDLTGITPRSFRFWRLNFPVLNSVPIQLGQLWIGSTKRSLTHNYSWGFQIGTEQRVIEHETDYGVSTIYSLGSKIWDFTATLRTSDAGMVSVVDWFDACNGRALPTLIVRDPAVNEARLVRWNTTRRQVQYDFKNDNVFQAAWREVSRGLVL